MESSVLATEWPSIMIPLPVKKLLNTLFTLLDLREHRAGDSLADEVFTPDGVIDGHIHVEGTGGSLRSELLIQNSFSALTENDTAIRRSRDRAWDAVQKRKHEVLKVYVCGTAADDLLLIGRITVTSVDESIKSGEFIARLDLDGAETQSPRISVYKVWMVSRIVLHFA